MFTKLHVSISIVKLRAARGAGAGGHVETVQYLCLVHIMYLSVLCETPGHPFIISPMPR